MPQLRRKIRTGIVVSDKMDKTIVVRVERITHHPLYKKTIRKQKKFKAHDEKNSAKTGNIVRIIETRPLSKEKRWRLLEIVK
jgi:small subunit ribosomal protein S17